MKQGPAEDMRVAVLKQLLKDEGIAVSSKAKRIANLFNTAKACTCHAHTTRSSSEINKTRKVTLIANVSIHPNVHAYNHSLSETKQCYFLDKHLPQEFYNHL